MLKVNVKDAKPFKSKVRGRNHLQTVDVTPQAITEEQMIGKPLSEQSKATIQENNFVKVVYKQESAQ